MIKIENIEIFGWKPAIRGMKAKGYRKTKNNKYECFASVNQNTINLGTKNTEEEAIETVYQYRVRRFINGVSPLNPDDCKIFNQNYVVFPNGKIFNLHGNEIRGCIDRYGYREVIINGTMELVHRIVALAFIPKIDNKYYVNHKDGNKLNNNADNLEWCTKSENTIHSFKNGLQKNINGIPVYTEAEKEYIKNNMFESPTKLAKTMNRNKDTIRKYQYKFRKEMIYEFN